MLTHFTVTIGNTVWQLLPPLTATDGGSMAVDLTNWNGFRDEYGKHIRKPTHCGYCPSRGRLENGRELCPVLFRLDCSARLSLQA